MFVSHCSWEREQWEMGWQMHQVPVALELLACALAVAALLPVLLRDVVMRAHAYAPVAVRVQTVLAVSQCAEGWVRPRILLRGIAECSLDEQELAVQGVWRLWTLCC
mmetsp:Transcript_2136/g.5426  ORF Transcript_2136/g.5426 Transcript_2136/m.5426 type:complete len:107 (-) Transcript_2136:1420-1740(-)